MIDQACGWQSRNLHKPENLPQVSSFIPMSEKTQMWKVQYLMISQPPIGWCWTCRVAIVKCRIIWPYVFMQRRCRHAQRREKFFYILKGSLYILFYKAITKYLGIYIRNISYASYSRTFLKCARYKSVLIPLNYWNSASHSSLKIFLPWPASPFTKERKSIWAAEREGREGGGFCWFKLTTVTAPWGGKGRGGRWCCLAHWSWRVPQRSTVWAVFVLLSGLFV